MIIACPQCTGPFELRDTDVAELVQLDCPHCRFRMILDFAAANDPRLVEAGMRMASGYRSAGEYRRAVAPGARPSLVAVDEPTPVAAEAPAPAPRVAAEAPRAPEPRIVEAPRAAEPRVAEAPAAPAAPATERVAAQTVVAPAPTPAADVDFDMDLPTRVATPRQPTQIGVAPPGVPMPVFEPAARVVHDDRAEPPSPRPAGVEIRSEPRPTPAVEAPVSRPAATRAPEPRAAEPRPAEVPTATNPRAAAAAAQTRPLPEPAEPAPTQPRARPERRSIPEPVAVASIDEGLEPAPRRGGALGAFFLVLLLVLVVGLTVASVVRKNTIDPRPLLEDLYRQYIHR